VILQEESYTSVANFLNDDPLPVYGQITEREVRSSPKENQSLEVKVKGISEMEFSLSIFDYTFTNYI